MGHLVYLPAAPPECMPYTPCPACPPGAPTWGGAVKRRTNVVHAAATPHVYHLRKTNKHKGVYVIFVYHLRKTNKHKGVIKRPAESKGN